MKKEPFEGSFFIFCALKPDSVPILPTAGGRRIENPEFIEGLSLDYARDCSILQLPAAGKIGSSHLSGVIVANHL